MAKQSQTGTSENTKSLITILLLVFLFPIGFVVMWVLPKWPLWVKGLVSLIPLAILLLMSFGALSVINPSAQMQRAECMKQCQAEGGNNCVAICANQ